MDVKQAYVSRLEAGTRNPAITTVQLIANALKLEPAALLKPLSPISTRANVYDGGEGEGWHYKSVLTGRSSPASGSWITPGPFEGAETVLK